LDAPPIIVCPYDAELFGHWWFEGPEFLDAVVRKACKDEALHMITPGDYLCKHRKLQIAEPAASSWGEGGYFDVWLNEKNQWMYPLLSKAQEKITELANCFKMPGKLQSRVLRQAARELLLSQASDWPFMINAGTNPEFAEKRIREHLSRFSRLFDEIQNDSINEEWLETIESQNNLFPDMNYRYWSS